MLWDDIRKAYPDQWLVIEAIEAHSTPDHQRHLDRLAVIETCPDGKAALARYRSYHQDFPQREFYYVHTSRMALDIREQIWVGMPMTARVV